MPPLDPKPSTFACRTTQREGLLNRAHEKKRAEHEKKRAEAEIPFLSTNDAADRCRTAWTRHEN